MSRLVERILNAPARNAPYWEILEYCRHLGIQKRTLESGYWVARIRNKPGGYKQRRLMPWYADEDSEAVALGLAREWFSSPEVARIASDPIPKGSRQTLIYCPWGDVYTLGHALKDYAAWKRIAATKSHYDSMVSLINHHILPRIGQVPLENLNGRHITDFSLQILETPPKRGKQQPMAMKRLEDLSPDQLRKRKKTLNTLIGILRLAVRLAWENGETDSERAWRCIRRVPVTDEPRTIFLNRSECTLLLYHCRADLGQLVQGALYTGCRIAELSNLKVRDVAKDVFGVYIAPLKSYRPRYVFLPHEGMAFFLNICRGKGPQDYVFSHQSGFSWQGRHKHLFKEAVTNAELPREFVFHGLRHTYASQLVQAGTPLIVVAQQLGHANTDTVSRTNGHLAPQVREAQIKSYFAPLDPHFAAQAETLSDELDILSRSLQAGDWREYGAVKHSSWPRSNFVQGNPEVTKVLKKIEIEDDLS